MTGIALEGRRKSDWRTGRRCFVENTTCTKDVSEGVGYVPAPLWGFPLDVRFPTAEAVG